MDRSRSRSPVRRDNSRRRTDSSGVDRKFNPNSDKMLYITNLSFKMEWKELKDIIREHAEVSFVEVLKNRNTGKSKGVAIVELTTKEGAKKVVESLHRQEVGGRTLSVVEIRDPAAFLRKIENDTGIDLLGGGGGGRDRNDRRSGAQRRPSPGLSYTGETYGLSQNFLDSLNLKLPLVNRVFVTNIDYTCGVGKLYDVFSMAGRICWFDLQLDKEGKSRGMAVVEYSHPIEAVQAVSMLHNQRLFDRTLTVKMDRFEKEQDRDRHGIPMGLKHVGMGLGANGAPLKDIASVVNQIQQQPAVNAFSNNGSSSIAPLIQASAQPSFSSYPSLASVFDQQPQYNQQQASAPAYNQPVQSQPIRQASPPPNSYFSNQGANYEQSSYAKNQPSYAIKQESGNGRPSYPVGSANPQSGRQSHGSYPPASLGEQTPSRVILIKNLPEDYTWAVVAQRLRQFGDFESVELVSAGTARVRFLHVSDAERAKKTLNGTVVENSTIYVEYII